MIHRRLIVHGRVQGVGFRYALARAAESRGVAGWAANRAGGTVEAVLEGEAGAVEALTRFCREGPRGALVERVEVEEGRPEALRGFAVR